MAKITKARTINFRFMNKIETFGQEKKLYPAPYLPVLEYSKALDASIVIREGTIIALDANGFVVPANGGVDSNIVYSRYDVDEEIAHIDTFNPANINASPAVTQLTMGTATGKITANRPIGIAFTDIYAYKYIQDPTYKLQYSVTVARSGLGLLAIDEDHKALTYNSGALIKSDGIGFVVPIEITGVDEHSDGASIKQAVEQYYEQQFGRVIDVLDANDKSLLGGMEYVVPVPGMNMPGIENGGYNNAIGLDDTHTKSVLFSFSF